MQETQTQLQMAHTPKNLPAIIIGAIVACILVLIVIVVIVTLVIVLLWKRSKMYTSSSRNDGILVDGSQGGTNKLK